MTIPVENELDGDMSFAKAFGVDNLLEHCIFCNEQTRFWHIASNTPCCERCGRTHDVADIKNTKLHHRTAK